MKKTLSVSAIENGTVIDHITSGQTLRIIKMLRLLNKKLTVTVGFNLPSKRIGLKDLIKIENHALTDKEASEITVLAPEATINIIQKFDVVKKIITSLPPNISGLFQCPNQQCITQKEKIESFFSISQQSRQVKLVCKFCEKAYDRNEVKVAS